LAETSLLNEKVIRYLNQLPEMTLNIIDVGCHMGHYMQEFKTSGIKKKLFVIGIAPLDYKTQEYDRYYQLAITDLPTKELEFYEHEDAACSSLLQMNSELVTYDLKERDTKWYVGREIHKVAQQKMVKTERLSNLIKENHLETIHFIKVDAQGHDINVVRSLDDRINNVLFIQLEAAATHNQDLLLYKGQQLLEDDIREMSAFGFDVAVVHDYGVLGYDGKPASPEADVIFYNRNKVSSEILNAMPQLNGMPQSFFAHHLQKFARLMQTVKRKLYTLIKLVLLP
jgi:FkbM family methyltransferase